MEWAEYYYGYGLCVIPAREGRPRVKWKEYETQRPSEKQVEQWFKGESLRTTAMQMYVVCGQTSGVVVLDCDSSAAESWWGDILGADLMASTAHALSGSGRGHHYWFELGEKSVRGSSRHTKGDPEHEDNWDLRGEGGGVIVPPSSHKSGGTYEWIVPLDQLQPWPYPEILNKTEAEGGILGQAGGSSSLAALLSDPGSGGRNNWVSKVLGHYAKALRFEDGFRATAEMVWMVAAGLPGEHDYDRAEFDRTTTSIWTSEQNKWASGKPEAENGFLVSNGQELLTRCEAKDDMWMAPWANFDMRAKSIITGEDGVSSYMVDVFTQNSGVIENAAITGEKFGSADQLSRWLSSRRLSLLTPKGDASMNIKPSTRLQLFLEAQNPKRMIGMPWMGWNDTEAGPIYVTEQGIIDEDGIHSLDDAGVLPDPRKSGSSEAVWNYGFADDEDTACAVLREILTFHDETVTALFGSIWALAPIKGAVMKVSSLFPHLAIVAPSEAGKTNGFFDLMLQANGRLNSGATYTPASLRDDLARHRGGFVWIDDPANIDDLGDLLRAAAGEGVHTRKGGQNWEQVVRTHLVAPIVISAEGLEMLSERAMADRVIQFEVPSPVGRQSRKGDYQQWDDIVTLMSTAGHLSKYAGWYVKRAWQWLISVGGPNGLRDLLLELRVGSGRSAEKTAVVRAGVRCLHYIAQCDEWKEHSIQHWTVGGGEPLDLITIVDDWAGAEASGEFTTGAYLTEVVIPTLLSNKGFVPSFRSAPIEAVFIDRNGRIRINIPQIASEWQRVAQRRTDRNRSSQLGSLRALMAESKNMDLGKSQPIKGKRYQMLSEAAAAGVLRRAGFDYATILAETTDDEELNLADEEGT